MKFSSEFGLAQKPEKNLGLVWNYEKISLNLL